MAKIVRSRIGPFDCLEVPGQPGAPCIVIFHGYGADSSDLAPLHQVLSAPAGTRWIFPNGPMKVPIGPHVFGQGWFPIDIEAIEQARMMGTTRDMSKSNPQGLKDMRQKAMQMIEELKVPWSKLVLGGFSQGAMLAMDVTLRAPENPAGLVILSGTLLDESTWKSLAPRRAGTPFFQSHGTVDDLLGYEYAQRLEKVLKDAGLKGELQTFEGGHEIPQEVMFNLGKFLKGLKF